MQTNLGCKDYCVRGMPKRSRSDDATEAGVAEGFEPLKFELTGRGRRKPQMSKQFQAAFFAESPKLTCCQASAITRSPHIWQIEGFVILTFRLSMRPSPRAAG
eukprot:3870871-Rhodomonas_salina.2